MSAIKAKTGIGSIELTQEELDKLVSDHMFILDAFLILLNPNFAEKCWDLPYTKRQAIEYAKEMYLESDSGYSNEFIERIFSGM